MQPPGMRQAGAHPEQLAERARRGAAGGRVCHSAQAQRGRGDVVEKLHVLVGVRVRAARAAVHALAHAQPEARAHQARAAGHLRSGARTLVAFSTLLACMGKWEGEKQEAVWWMPINAHDKCAANEEPHHEAHAWAASLGDCHGS